MLPYWVLGVAAYLLLRTPTKLRFPNYERHPMSVRRSRLRQSGSNPNSIPGSRGVIDVLRDLPATASPCQGPPATTIPASCSHRRADLRSPASTTPPTSPAGNRAHQIRRLRLASPSGPSSSAEPPLPLMGLGAAIGLYCPSHESGLALTSATNEGRSVTAGQSLAPLPPSNCPANRCCAPSP